MSGVALYAACAGSAVAQDGAGLYEPFPEPGGPSVSRDFIRELRPPGSGLASELSRADLDRGTRVRANDLPGGMALPAVVAQSPSERAEPGAFLGSAPGWLGAAGLLALAAAAARRLAPR
jgi:hypothetical protein